MAKVPPFGELIAATVSSAVHLEMRDAYTPDDRRFLDWQAGRLLPEQANPEWSAIVRSHTTSNACAHNFTIEGSSASSSSTISPVPEK